MSPTKVRGLTEDLLAIWAATRHLRYHMGVSFFRGCNLEASSCWDCPPCLFVSGLRGMFAMLPLPDSSSIKMR